MPRAWEAMINAELDLRTVVFALWVFENLPTEQQAAECQLMCAQIRNHDPLHRTADALYDFTNGQGGIPAAPVDGYGHGTHVAGLIAGSGALSEGQFEGVAPNAHLIGLRVLDNSGSGSSMPFCVRWRRLRRR